MSCRGLPRGGNGEGIEVGFRWVYRAAKRWQGWGGEGVVVSCSGLPGVGR